MDAGFFKGTSTDQDNRFVDKNKKLMKTMKFAENLEKKVDMTRVDMETIRPWINKTITEYLSYEDDVLVEFVCNQLESSSPDGRLMQMNLTGFLNAKNAREFMQKLWQLLLSAMDDICGIPAELMEQKKEQIRLKQAEQERINETLKTQQSIIQEAIAKIKINAANSNRCTSPKPGKTSNLTANILPQPASEAANKGSTGSSLAVESQTKSYPTEDVTSSFDSATVDATNNKKEKSSKDFSDRLRKPSSYGRNRIRSPSSLQRSRRSRDAAPCHKSSLDKRSQSREAARRDRCRSSRRSLSSSRKVSSKQQRSSSPRQQKSSSPRHHISPRHERTGTSLRDPSHRPRPEKTRYGSSRGNDCRDSSRRDYQSSRSHDQVEGTRGKQSDRKRSQSRASSPKKERDARSTERLSSFHSRIRRSHDNRQASPDSPDLVHPKSTRNGSKTSFLPSRVRNDPSPHRRLTHKYSPSPVAHHLRPPSTTLPPPHHQPSRAMAVNNDHYSTSTRLVYSDDRHLSPPVEGHQRHRSPSDGRAERLHCPPDLRWEHEILLSPSSRYDLRGDCTYRPITPPAFGSRPDKRRSSSFYEDCSAVRWNENDSRNRHLSPGTRGTTDFELLQRSSPAPARRYRVSPSMDRYPNGLDVGWTSTHREVVHHSKTGAHDFDKIRDERSFSRTLEAEFRDSPSLAKLSYSSGGRAKGLPYNDDDRISLDYHSRGNRRSQNLPVPHDRESYAYVRTAEFSRGEDYEERFRVTDSRDHHQRKDYEHGSAQQMLPGQHRDEYNSLRCGDRHQATNYDRINDCSQPPTQSFREELSRSRNLRGSRSPLWSKSVHSSRSLHRSDMPLATERSRMRSRSPYGASDMMSDYAINKRSPSYHFSTERGMDRAEEGEDQSHRKLFRRTLPSSSPDPHLYQTSRSGDQREKDSQRGIGGGGGGSKYDQTHQSVTRHHSPVSRKRARPNDGIDTAADLASSDSSPSIPQRRSPSGRSEASVECYRYGEEERGAENAVEGQMSRSPSRVSPPRKRMKAHSNCEVEQPSEDEEEEAEKKKKKKRKKDKKKKKRKKHKKHKKRKHSNNSDDCESDSPNEVVNGTTRSKYDNCEFRRDPEENSPASLTAFNSLESDSDGR